MKTVDGISVARRSLLKGSAALAGLWPLSLHQEVGFPFADSERPTSGVETTHRGNVAIVSLDRPSLGNRLDPSDYADLLAAFQAIDTNDTIRATVLTGRGEHFSKGIVGTSREIDAMRLGLGAPPGSWRLSAKPVVGVVHGQTRDLGVALALFTDVRVAGSDATLGWQDHIHANLFHARLADEIGRSNARRFLLTGDDLSAHEAWRLGLVQHVAANSLEAVEEAIAIAERIALRTAPPNLA